MIVKHRKMKLRHNPLMIAVATVAEKTINGSRGTKSRCIKKG